MSIRWIRSVCLFLLLLAALAPLASAELWQVRDTSNNQVIPPDGLALFPDIVPPFLAQRVYAIYNVGSSLPQLLSSCSVTGDSSFVISIYPYAPTEPGAMVYPGLSASLAIQHFPNTVGTQEAMVHCSGAGPVSFRVRGRVLSPNPYLVLQTAAGNGVGHSFDFGSTPSNTALTRDFRILNLGNQPLSISLATTGAAYSVAAAPRASIAAGGQANFSLRLLSGATGLATGQLVITNNDPNDNPYTVSLSGMVTAGPSGQIRVRDGNGGATVAQGATLYIGTTPINTPLLRTFWIDNLSEKLSLTINNPNSFLSGTNFSLATPPASSIAPGGSTSFTVRFQSAFVSTYDASVSLASNDFAHTPYHFTLRASTANAPEPRIRVVSSGVTIGLGGTADFGALAPNQSVTRSFEVWNEGGAALSLSNLEVSGSNYVPMTLPGASVAAGGQTSFSIRFVGTATPGTYYGSVLLYHNDPSEANPLSFSLETRVQSNEPTVTLSTPDNHASEWGLSGPSPGRFTLTRTGINSTQPLTVQVAWTGTATNGADYQSMPITQMFPAGQTTLDVVLQPINDSTVEDVETATLTLVDADGYALGGAKTGTVSIYNDDYAACTTGGTQLCLRNGRFKVQLTGMVGSTPFPGQAVPLNDSTGGFWLFSPGNVELGVKVLEAPDHLGYWVYHGAATDVSYTFTVTDLANVSKFKTYNNEEPYCGGGDVGAFLRSVALPPAELVNGGGFEVAAQPQLQEIHQAACVPSSTTSCLLNGRFRVTVLYKNGPFAPYLPAQAAPAIGESAFFWFFSPDNLEIFVKVLDGTAINQRYWVYFGSMTDVPYRIEILDTLTLASQEYDSEDYGNFCGFGDSNAF
jgi:hypothetical protein